VHENELSFVEWQHTLHWWIPTVDQSLTKESRLRLLKFGFPQAKLYCARTAEKRLCGHRYSQHTAPHHTHSDRHVSTTWSGYNPYNPGHHGPGSIKRGPDSLELRGKAPQLDIWGIWGTYGPLWGHHSRPDHWTGSDKREDMWGVVGKWTLEGVRSMCVPNSTMFPK
jgi:hypothetical protein